MKVIDLLVQIANGENVPDKIKYDTKEYIFRNYDYKEYYKNSIDEQTSFIERIDFYKLNDEIEIIEEPEEPEEDKPIEKINGLKHPLTERLSLIREDIGLAFETIDLLIDKVNELEREMKIDE